MAAIDKAAIGWSIAIVAAGVAIAFMGSGMQGQGPAPMTAPTTSSPVTAPSQPAPTPATTQPTKDPFADVVEKVKEKASTAKPAEDMKMTETPAAPAPAAPAPAAPAPAAPAPAAPAPAPAAPAPAPAGPQTVDVKIPTGTSSPGCEQTKSCFAPDTVTINRGDKVIWTNVDTAAHTVTSGSPTDGPSGVFDSSLIMGGNSYEFTFTDSGSYSYFCMVHPWMTGSVQVN